jgi:hypothetical protein
MILQLFILRLSHYLAKMIWYDEFVLDMPVKVYKRLQLVLNVVVY